MKGQLTFINFVAIFVTLVLYFVLLPVLNDISAQTVAELEASPNEMTSLMVTLIYLVPFILLLALVITTFNQAIPNREGYG